MPPKPPLVYQLSTATYLAYRDFETGKLYTFLGNDKPCVSDTSYLSVDELRRTLKHRWGKTYRIEEIEDGLRLTPIPPSGCGEAYQDVTLIAVGDDQLK
jgi:hypothetical protein